MGAHPHLRLVPDEEPRVARAFVLAPGNIHFVAADSPNGPDLPSIRYDDLQGRTMEEAFIDLGKNLVGSALSVDAVVHDADTYGPIFVTDVVDPNKFKPHASAILVPVMHLGIFVPRAHIVKNAVRQARLQR